MNSTARTSTTRLTRDGRPALSIPFLRTRLSPAGWAAVLAPGWLAGITLAVVTGRGKPGVGRVLACAAGGAAAGVLIARGVDELHWRSRAVSLEVQEPDVALDLMQAVRAEGVRAEMVRADTVRADMVGADSIGADHVQSAPAYAVRYRAKDDRRVRAVLAEQQG